MVENGRPPNRLSVDMHSPDYNAAILRRGVEVFLNDIRQIGCVVRYDVDKGELVRYKRTAWGKFVTDKFHQRLTETRYGVIRVIWRDEL